MKKRLASEEEEAVWLLFSHIADHVGDAGGGPRVSETEIKVLVDEHGLLDALSRVSRVFFFFWKFVFFLSCFINTLKMSKKTKGLVEQRTQRTAPAYC